MYLQYIIINKKLKKLMLDRTKKLFRLNISIYLLSYKQ